MYLSEMQPGPKTVPPRNVSSKELDLLSQIVEKRLGMDLNRRRQERLLQMLEKRVKESGRKDLMDYLNFVDFSPDHPEWRFLEEILTIQKTEFFRESSQMTYLQEEILPEIKAKKSSCDKTLEVESVCAKATDATNIKTNDISCFIIFYPSFCRLYLFPNAPRVPQLPNQYRNREGSR